MLKISRKPLISMVILIKLLIVWYLMDIMPDLKFLITKIIKNTYIPIILITKKN
jgi:hypothetical protein